MNLLKMFETQQKLDDHIVVEKGLEGVDLLEKKILALLTELGELANEWRGFKFWSEDQDSRNKNVKCHSCKGKGFFDFTLPFGNEHFTEDCGYCGGTGIQEKNPMLTEYVDCLHFILSIGNELEMLDEDEWTVTDGPIADNITSQFAVVHSHVISIWKYNMADMYADISYKVLMTEFIGLGEMLGFTKDQIEQAYYYKNKINHQRQENGY